ncbi:MAG: type III secretion system export apparatus subunit SctT [Pseudomonadota bacterium]
MAADIPSLFVHAHPVLMGLPRIGAALLVLPLMPNAVVPRLVRAGVAMVFVLSAYPMLAQSVAGLNWDAAQWMAFVLKEGFIGAMIGYAMGMLLWALGAVGAIIDTQAGYNNAQIFDPFGGHTQGPLSILLTQFGVFLFMCFGGLQVFLQLLYESLQLWPVNAFTPSLGPVFRDLAIQSSTSLLELATRLSAPVIGALLVVELGVGLLNKLAPQLNTYFFAMPLKGLAAMLVLVLMMSHLLDVFTRQIVGSQGIVKALDAAWRGGP